MTTPLSADNYAKILNFCELHNIDPDDFIKQRLGMPVCIDLSRLVNKGCVELYSGAVINIFNPKPETINVEDIAEGLAYQYRWSGHSKSKITVAEHSVRVSWRANNKIAALFHDASEGLGLNDMATPIKSGMREYQFIEDNLMTCVAQRFGFNWPLDTDVKAADRAELLREWKFVVTKPDAEVWSPELAKTIFLEHYASYSK
jgi:hypothetical protein